MVFVSKTTYTQTNTTNARVYFKCKLYLKNSMKLIENIFLGGHPGAFCHPHSWKQEYYFFWPYQKTRRYVLHSPFSLKFDSY